MKLKGWIKTRWWMRGYYIKRVKQFLCSFTRHRRKPINSYIARCEKCKKFFDIKKGVKMKKTTLNYLIWLFIAFLFAVIAADYTMRIDLNTNRILDQFNKEKTK